jgi:hypothetical protein
VADVFALCAVELVVDDDDLDDEAGRSVVEGDAERVPPPQAASTDPATTRQATTPAARQQRLRGAARLCRCAPGCAPGSPPTTRARAEMILEARPLLVQLSFM